MKKIIALVLSLALVFTLAGCGSTADKNDKETITIVLDWTPNTNHTGIFVARHSSAFLSRILLRLLS